MSLYYNLILILHMHMKDSGSLFCLKSQLIAIAIAYAEKNTEYFFAGIINRKLAVSLIIISFFLF